MAKDKAKRATRIRASRLLSALKDVIGAVPGKSTIPILSHVLFEAGNGAIRVTATDMDMEVRRECASDDRDGPNGAEWAASVAPFAVALPGKPLVALLGQIDGDAMVTISIADDVSASTPGRVTIAAGRARFRMLSLPSVDFPRLAAFARDGEFEIGAGALADALDAVSYAVSSEETCYYLGGVYWHAHDLDLRMAATDGHRLARLRMDAPMGAHSLPAMIVPRGAVAMLDKLLAHAVKADAGAVTQVAFNEAGSVVGFAMAAEDDGEVELITKTIDGAFPDYARVIPTNLPGRLTIGRAVLAEAVARIAAIAHKDSRLMRFDVSADRIELSAVNVDLGDGAEEIELGVMTGEAITLGFDSRYLREVLGKIATDDVAIRWSTNDAPTRIEPVGGEGEKDGEQPRNLHVLMPVRV